MVRAEGEPALLPGAAGRPTPAGRHRAGGLRGETLGVRRAVRPLPGVRGHRTQDVQVRGGGPSDSGELGESSAVGQSLLPLAAGERPGEAVQW